jgi:hypothetical protein
MPEPRGLSRIELSGSFDVNWADFFEDMLVREHVEQGIVRSTTLVGHPRDLEAFLGTLHMLIDRGFQVRAFAYSQAGADKVNC